MTIPIASLTCVLAFAGMTPTAFTAQLQTVVAALHVQPETIDTGTIIQVDADAKSFVLRTRAAQRIEFNVDDETVYILNGNPSTMEEALQSDREATVTHDDRNATRVEVVDEERDL